MLHDLTSHLQIISRPLAESLQQLKWLNSCEMVLPGQQQSSSVSNTLLLPCIVNGQTQHLPQPLRFRA